MINRTVQIVSVLSLFLLAGCSLFSIPKGSLQPKNDTTVDNSFSSKQLSWDKSIFAVDYIVQISETEDFGNDPLWINTEQRHYISLYEIPHLPESFWWRVKPVQSLPIFPSSWSEPRKLTVRRPPVPVIGLDPEKPVSREGAVLTFHWNNHLKWDDYGICLTFSDPSLGRVIGKEEVYGLGYTKGVNSCEVDLTSLLEDKPGKIIPVDGMLQLECTWQTINHVYELSPPHEDPLTITIPVSELDGAITASGDLLRSKAYGDTFLQDPLPLYHFNKETWPDDFYRMFRLDRAAHNTATAVVMNETTLYSRSDNGETAILKQLERGTELQLSLNEPYFWIDVYPPENNRDGYRLMAGVTHGEVEGYVDMKDLLFPIDSESAGQPEWTFGRMFWSKKESAILKGEGDSLYLMTGLCALSDKGEQVVYPLCDWKGDGVSSYLLPDRVFTEDRDGDGTAELVIKGPGGAYKPYSSAGWSGHRIMILRFRDNQWSEILDCSFPGSNRNSEWLWRDSDGDGIRETVWNQALFVSSDFEFDGDDTLRYYENTWILNPISGAYTLTEENSKHGVWSDSVKHLHQRQQEGDIIDCFP